MYLDIFDTVDVCQEGIYFKVFLKIFLWLKLDKESSVNTQDSERDRFDQRSLKVIAFLQSFKNHSSQYNTLLTDLI